MNWLWYLWVGLRDKTVALGAIILLNFRVTGVNPKLGCFVQQISSFLCCSFSVFLLLRIRVIFVSLHHYNCNYNCRLNVLARTHARAHTQMCIRDRIYVVTIFKNKQ